MNFNGKADPRQSDTKTGESQTPQKSDEKRGFSVQTPDGERFHITPPNKGTDNPSVTKLEF